MPKKKKLNKESSTSTGGSSSSSSSLSTTESQPDDSEFENDRTKKQRVRWVYQLDYLVCIFALTVDLKSVLTFPVTCFKYGGGSFVLVYLIVTFLVSLPLLYLETLLGQTVQKGPIAFWDICPLMKGVGITQIIISLATLPVRVMTMTYTIIYFKNTFESPLPWTCSEQPGTKEQICSNKPIVMSEHDNDNMLNGTYPSYLYYESKILKIGESHGLYDVGSIQASIVLILFFVILFNFGVLFYGFRALSKLSYFFALVPFLCLLLLITNGMFLRGMKEGLVRYLYFDYTKLYDVKLWSKALEHSLISTANGFGIHIFYSSYSKPTSGMIFRNCLLVTGANALISFLASVMVALYLGNLNYVLNGKLDLASVLLTDVRSFAFEFLLFAFSNLSGSKFWSVLFFILIFTLCFSSTLGNLIAASESIYEILPLKLQKKLFTRTFIRVTIIIPIFLVCILCSFNGGVFIVHMMDEFNSGPIYALALFCEMFALTWIYGIQFICRDSYNCLNVVPARFIQILWKFVGPPAFLFFTVYNFIAINLPTYKIMVPQKDWMAVPGYDIHTGIYKYPEGTYVYIVGILMVQFLPIPILMFYKLHQYGQDLFITMSPVWEHDEIEKHGNIRSLFNHYFNNGKTKGIEVDASYFSYYAIFSEKVSSPPAKQERADGDDEEEDEDDDSI